MKQTNKITDTGIKFFGKRVLLEKSGDGKYDGALKRMFVKDYNKSGPLEIKSEDAQILLAGPQQQEITRPAETCEPEQAYPKAE